MGKTDAANIAKEGEPFLSKADDELIVYSNMRGEGSSENRNKNGTSSPAEVILGKVGTTVTAPKSLLSVHAWNAALAPNPATSVFSAINEVRRTNLQDYQYEGDFFL